MNGKNKGACPHLVRLGAKDPINLTQLREDGENEALVLDAGQGVGQVRDEMDSLLWVEVLFYQDPRLGVVVLLRALVGVFIVVALQALRPERGGLEGGVRGGAAVQRREVVGPLPLRLLLMCAPNVVGGNARTAVWKVDGDLKEVGPEAVELGVRVDHKTALEKLVGRETWDGVGVTIREGI